MILGATTLTIERVAGGSLVNGRWVDGAATTFPLTGSWQPMSGRQREQLPELYRTRHTARLLCAPDQPQLAPVDVAARARQDVVVRQGRRYEVIGVEDWTDHARGVPHVAYTLAEIGADEEGRR